MGTTENAFDPIRKGESCLLNVVDDHFLVKIVEMDEEKIRVTFPGKDYPVEGMRVYLEFHDETGFDCYPTHVLEGPVSGASSIVLERPREPRRVMHRTSVRIPTDLTVQVKDQVHVRKYDAALLNLSSGGALIKTIAPFNFSTTVQISFSLPGEPAYTALGHVVHVSTTDDNKDESRLFGVRFLDLDPAILRSLNRYVSERMRDIYG